MPALAQRVSRAFSNDVLRSTLWFFRCLHFDFSAVYTPSFQLKLI